MKLLIGNIEITLSVKTTKYYEIIGGHTGEVIGYCTSQGEDDVRHEEPKATLRKISRRQYDEAMAS